MTSTKRLAINKTAPIKTGKSYFSIAFTMTRPIPFQSKTYSTKTAPARREANHPDIVVIIGLMAFFRDLIVTHIDYRVEVWTIGMGTFTYDYNQTITHAVLEFFMIIVFYIILISLVRLLDDEADYGSQNTKDYPKQSTIHKLICNLRKQIKQNTRHPFTL